MAQEVVVRFRINDNGELEGIANKAEKAAKSTDKLNKSRSRYNKTEKGVGQLTNNTTKAFSKQAQGISSGIVPAYATLAANIFAVTAAFGALERAVANAKLEESLVFTGRAAGREFRVLADELRGVADGALSTAEAMRAVSFGISSGFDETQLKNFTQIAKGASLALGRNLTDSMDRLVRGAAKLEPEILDELGIMVRLDDAANDYAVTLGKNANELTQFERRMAFANAIMEQGLQKYGALNNSLEASPYSKMAATFVDTTQTLMEGLAAFFSPIAQLLADNVVVLMGAVAALGTSVVGAMIPALVDGGHAMADMSKDTANAAKESLRSLKSFKGAPKIFDELSEKVANGTATNAEYKQLKNSLAASERGHAATLERVTKAHGKNSKVLAEKNEKIDNVRLATNQLAQAEMLEAQASQLQARSDALSAAAALDLKGTINALTTAWTLETAANTSATASAGGFGAMLTWLRTRISLTVFSLKTLAVFTMAAIPLLGVVLMLGGLLYETFSSLFASDPHPLTDAIESMDKTLKDMPEGLIQFEETYASVQSRSEKFNASLTLTAGLIAGATAKLNEFRMIQNGTIVNDKVTAQLAKFRLEREKKALQEKLKGLNLSEAATDGGSQGYSSLQAMLGANQGSSQTAQESRDTDALVEAKRRLKAVDEELADLAEKKAGDDVERDATLRQLLATQAQLGAQESVVRALGGDNVGEAEILAESLTRMDKIISDLAMASEDDLPAALEAARQGMVKLNNDTQNALDTYKTMGELVADVTKRFNDLKPAVGPFATDLNLISPIIEKIGKDANSVPAMLTPEILEEAKAAFVLYGISMENGIEAAAEKFRELHKEMKAVNEAALNEPMRQARSEGVVSLASSVGLDTMAEDEKLVFIKEQLALRHRMQEVEVDAEEKRKRAVEIERLITKERETQMALLKAEAERNTFLGVGGASSNFQAMAGSTNFQEVFKNPAEGADSTFGMGDKIAAARTATQGFIDDLKALGPEGELMATINESALGMAEMFGNAFDKMKKGTFEFKDGLNVAASVVSGLAAIQAAKSKAAIAGVDREIAAEKKRDGKSAASVAKIKALEAKKDKMKRKAFEQDKKAKMASTVINTASGIVAALDDLPFPANIALAGMIGVMGAQQLAVISGMQYQGGGGGAPAGPSKVSVGSKSNTVDLARARSPAGELAYARGASGTGQGMTNYKPTPAFTGAKYRAAGGAAFMIGEQGPEMFVPEMPGTIVPADEVDDTRGISAPTNINFTIQAIDGQSVQEMLLGQRGNIIGMIRDAANASGEPFIESVNVLSDSEEFNPAVMRN